MTNKGYLTKQKTRKALHTNRAVFIHDDVHIMKCRGLIFIIKEWYDS
jgi:hypothetical protein